MPFLFRSFILLVALLSSFSAIAQPPIVVFTGSPTSGCAPLPVNFTDQSNGNPTSWLWTFSGPNGVPANAGTSVLKNPGWVFVAPGTYTVTLKATNSTGNTTLTKTAYITVRDTPIVNFTTSADTICPCSPVGFSNTSSAGGPGPHTYQWYFANGNPSSATGANPSSSFCTGPNNVTLTVTNNYGCTRSKTRTNLIRVFPKPEADFSAGNNTVFCERNTSNFTSNFTATVTGGKAPYTYNWDFGYAGATGTGAAISHTFPGPAPATYTVRLIVTDANGCSDTVTKNGLVKISTITASLTGPTGVCVGIPFTFNNTTPNSNAVWNVGSSGNIVANPNLTYILENPGTYKIKLTANNTDGCTDTAVKMLTVYPQPTVDFASSPLLPCPGPQTIQFTTSGNATTFYWLFGGPTPNTGTGANPTHTYGNGDFDVTLIATNAQGCIDTVTKTNHIRLYDLEFEAIQDKLGDCIPAKIKFKTYMNSRGLVNNYPYKPGSVYTWDFGENSSSKLTTTIDSVEYTYTTLGTFRVTVKAVTPNGCEVFDTLTVKTGSKPIANFSVSDPNPCGRSRISFTNLSTNATSYQWDFGLPDPPWNTTSFLVNPTFVYDTPGVFSVTLIANNNECKDTIKKTALMHVKPPYAKFETQWHCDNQLKVTFLNKSDTAITSAWDFTYPAGINTSTQVSPTFIFPSLGTYQVRLITTNPLRGCTDTIIKTILLSDPVPSFTIDKSAICLYDSATLTGSVTGGPYKRVKWVIDGDSVANTLVYKHAFNKSGSPRIKFEIVDSHDCLDSFVSSSFLLVARPITKFTASPTTGCVALTVNFTDQTTTPAGSSVVSRQWIYGNGGATLPGNTATNTYWARGKFDVTLITTDNIGCKDTLKKTEYITAIKPSAAFTVTKAGACLNEELTFNCPNTDPLTFDWNFGDGSTANVQTPKHKYQNTGQYTVRLIVTDPNGCKDTLTRLNMIDITKPKARLAMSDSFNVCPPMVVDFDGTASTNMVGWKLISGTGNIFIPPAPLAQPKVTDVYFTSSYYTVLFIVYDANNCADTAIRHADILGYNGSMTYSPLSGCSPLNVDFISKVNPSASITWDFSDGVVILAGTGAPSISHTYTVPGAYVPKIIISDGGGCTAGSLGLDTIKVDGILTDFTYSPACVGSVVKFEDKSQGVFSGIQNRLWTFDNGQTSYFSTPSYTFSTAGTYPVRLEVTNKNGCKDTLEKMIVVNPLPDISAGEDTIVCLKDMAQLTGSGGVSYIWSPTGTLSCSNCPDPQAKPIVPTVYTVIGTDANQCKDTDEVEIKIKTKVLSTAAEGGEICIDEKYTLKVEGGREYVWSPAGSLDDSKSNTPKAAPKETTTYTVIAYEASCIPDTNQVKVIVYPKPTVRASGTQTIIAGNEAQILAQGELIHKFRWSPPGSLNCSDCPDPKATPSKTTIYNVTAITDHGCEDSAKVTITVLCDESQVFIPNTFTPNGDGQNDLFYPRGNGIDKVKSFRVFNRWGEIVHQRTEFPINDAQYGWDGTYKGTNLPPDVFVYIVEAYCNNGEIFLLKGDVSIIR